MIENMTAFQSFLCWTRLYEYILLKQHQPDDSYHHENDSQNTDANEDNIAQVMRHRFWLPCAAIIVIVSLLGLLLKTTLLC